jgi:hypothetical protein
MSGRLDKAWEIVRQIDSLLTDLIGILKPYIDPVDEWDLERDAVEIVERLSSWVEAVSRVVEEREG